MSHQNKLKLPIRREKPWIRRAQIIDASLRLARDVGAQGLFREKIAKEAGVCPSLVHRYFAGMDILREDVIKTAFDRMDTEVLYKSLSIHDFKKLNTNPALAKQVMDYVTL